MRCGHTQTQDTLPGNCCLNSFPPDKCQSKHVCPLLLPTWHILHILPFTLPGPNTGQLGAGFWVLRVAAEARWRCCKSSWISPFTLQQDLLRWTGDQGGALVTTLKIRLLWPFCFMEQILFILFIFFIPQYWTLLLLNFLLSLHGSTALNEDRKISVLFFKTSVSN